MERFDPSRMAAAPRLAPPIDILGIGLEVGAETQGTEMGWKAMRLAGLPQALEALGLSVTVADARFAKPLDADLILRLAREHEALITVEEGAMGGFGAFVLQLLAEKGALDGGLKVRTLHLPDIFQDQDSPVAMYGQAGLNAEHIAAREDCADRIAALARPGDRIAVMGARDDTLTEFARSILTRLP